nr:PREDICTED: uncharacterized protein LOC108952150 [Musa acuminata subsp. malaccensis]
MAHHFCVTGFLPLAATDGDPHTLVGYVVTRGGVWNVPLQLSWMLEVWREGSTIKWDAMHPPTEPYTAKHEEHGQTHALEFFFCLRRSNLVVMLALRFKHGLHSDFLLHVSFWKRFLQRELGHYCLD